MVDVVGWGYNDMDPVFEGLPVGQKAGILRTKVTRTK